MTLPDTFIARLPTSEGRGGLVRVRVEPLTSAVASYWHCSVQPEITKARPSGPDADWNWTVIEAKVRGFADDGARGFVISRLDIPAPSGLDWAGRPVALCACVGPCAPFGGGESAGIYCWYFATAPKAFVGLPKLGRVGEACVDSVVVTSVQLGLAGRMWLHADPAGGMDLRDFYVRCGMTNHPVGAPMPNGFRNDGSIFCHDSGSARTALERMNEYRVESAAC